MGSSIADAPCDPKQGPRSKGPGRTIAFFGHDSTESTVIKRVTAFQAHGAHVIGFMFRRARAKEARPPTWDNQNLGTTVDRNYLWRAPKLLAAAVKLLRYRQLLRCCQIYYARNIDMLFLAVLAKGLVRSKAPVAYEVLDVQRVFVGDRLANKVFRWAESFLLARSDMLVVSSPDFISEYFLPYQHYSGRWRLLENKVFDDQAGPGLAQHLGRRPPGPPWVIGWFGTLRCVRSLEVLRRIADAGGDCVIVHIRGLSSQEDLTTEAIEAACAGRKNIFYRGPYRSPHDLASIYGPIHFAWCIDYLDAGGNSDWLLPNRLYEGGLMGSLALARSNTATSRMVERLGLGRVFDEPLESTVGQFLASLDAATYENMWRSLEALSRSTFADLTDTHDLLRELGGLAEASVETPI
jgi:succinoglycan biosynthesis protein ExoL